MGCLSRFVSLPLCRLAHKECARSQQHARAGVRDHDSSDLSGLSDLTLRSRTERVPFPVNGRSVEHNAGCSFWCAALRCERVGGRAGVRAYGVCERALVDCLRACVRACRQAGGRVLNNQCCSRRGQWVAEGVTEVGSVEERLMALMSKVCEVCSDASRISESLMDLLPEPGSSRRATSQK